MQQVNSSAEPRANTTPCRLPVLWGVVSFSAIRPRWRTETGVRLCKRGDLMLCAKWRPGKPRMKREAPMYIGTLEEVLFKPLSTSPLLPFTGWMLPESPERGETVPTGGNLFVFKMQLPGKSSPELGVVIQRAWRGPSAFMSSSACASRNLGSNLRVPKRLRTYSIFALYVCDGIEVGSRLLGDRVQAHDKKRVESATSGKQLAHWAPGLLNKLSCPLHGIAIWLGVGHPVPRPVVHAREE
jgi:hypothetical protein